MNLIAFELIYSECSSLYLGIATTPPAVMKKLQKLHSPFNSNPSLFIKKFWKYQFLPLFRPPTPPPFY